MSAKTHDRSVCQTGMIPRSACIRTLTAYNQYNVYFIYLYFFSAFIQAQAGLLKSTLSPNVLTAVTRIADYCMPIQSGIFNAQ